MARKKSPAVEEIAPEIIDETITENQNTVAVLQSAHSEERDTLNQMIGQIQMTGAIAKLTTVVGLTKLAHIKETRMYKALAGKKGIARDGSEIADIGTWEGFCLAIGTTRQKADEDILNLKSFGEEVLEDLSKVGAGYRELRQLRRLPDDEKTALIEAAKTGDKDAFVDLAEEIITKHSREKTELQKELEEAKADLVAKDEVAEQNAKRINELQQKVARIKKMPVDEMVAEIRAEIAALITSIDHEMRVNFYNAIETLREAEGDHGEFIRTQLNTLADTLEFLQVELGGEQPEWMNE